MTDGLRIWTVSFLKPFLKCPLLGPRGHFLSYHTEKMLAPVSLPFCLNHGCTSMKVPCRGMGTLAEWNLYSRIWGGKQGTLWDFMWHCKAVHCVVLSCYKELKLFTEQWLYRNVFYCLGACNVKTSSCLPTGCIFNNMRCKQLQTKI